jgi:hypothetical protein
MSKIFLTFLFVLSFFVLTPCHLFAVDNGNGVDVTNVNLVHSFGMRGEWFTSFDPSLTTYVYNESGESAVTSGLMDALNIVDKRTIYVSVPVLGSTSITVRAEGKHKGSTEWAEINSQTFSTATSIAVIWPVLEFSGDIRVGVKRDGTDGTDSVNVSGEFTTQKK